MDVRKILVMIGCVGIILILFVITPALLSKAKKSAPKKQNSNTVKTVSAESKKKDTPRPEMKKHLQSSARSEKKVKKTTAVPSSARVSTPAPKPASVKNKLSAEEQAVGMGDPFTYTGAGSGSGDYTPLSGNKHVGVISVKGIIRMDGEDPKAILHLKDSNRVHYVSKNSVIRVSVGDKKGSSPAEAYVVVKDIRNDEVELIQLERPDKVIIVR